MRVSRGSHPGLSKWALNSEHCPYKKHKQERWRGGGSGSEGRSRGWRDAVRSQGPPRATGAGTGRRASPRSLLRVPPCSHPDFDVWPPESREDGFVLFQAPAFVVLHSSSPRAQITGQDPTRPSLCLLVFPWTGRPALGV